MAEFDIRDTTITTRPISRRAFFEGLMLAKPIWPDGLKANHRTHIEIIRRLQDVIPGYIDSTAKPSEHQVPNLFYSTCFDIPLSLGRVNVTVELVDDLKELLRGESRITKTGLAHEKGMQGSLDQLCEKLDRDTGTAIEARYIPSPGLRLGVPLVGWGQEETNCIALKALGCAVNTLCRGSALTESAYAYDKYGFLHGPISDRYPIICNIGSLQARLKHPTLERMRMSEQSVGGFMSWLRNSAPDVNHVAMMLALATEQNEKIRYAQKECLKGNLGDKTLQIITKMRDLYFQEAKLAFDSLHPPKNDRMVYLAD